MIRNFYLLLIFFSLYNIGCIDTIEFDLDAKDSQILVYTEIQPNKAFQIKVSTSTIINSNFEITYPENAKISISNEGSVLDDNFIFRIEDGCYVGLEAKEMVPYTLEVSIPDMNIIPVISQTMIPASQKFEEIKLSNYELIDLGDGTSHHKFWVELLIDQSNEEGTSYLQIIPQRRKIEKDQFTGDYLYSSEYDKMDILEIVADVNATEILTHKSGIFVDGKKLHSGEVMLLLKTSSPLINDMDIFEYVHFTLNTLTYEAFNYNIIKNKQLASQDTPLFEPIISYTNINYGIGLFGAFNSKTDSILIK